MSHRPPFGRLPGPYRVAPPVVPAAPVPFGRRRVVPGVPSSRLTRGQNHG